MQTWMQTWKQQLSHRYGQILLYSFLIGVLFQLG